MTKMNGESHVTLKETIDITDKEKQIFNLLLQVVTHFNLETTIRVAGGWVRDKLLGKESSDIDIALDNMLGGEFCEKLKEYLVFTGERTQKLRDVNIKKNPADTSKPLDKASILLYDVCIDFVNFVRIEDWASNSRISTTQFSTPEQDAFRRDLTINSLFYNIHTCSVEDFTGRGLDDLKSGKIVTPVPPKERFLYDPFTVLRAIRFSTRFDFEMDEELKVAITDDDVKSAFLGDVIKERIGLEINRMVNGNEPVKAMKYIYDLGWFSVVFTPPANYKPLISQDQEKNCIEFMDLALRQFHDVGCSFTEEEKKFYLYASLFFPLRKTVRIDKKRQPVPVVKYIFKKSLALGAPSSDNVRRLHNGVEKFLCLIPFILSNEDMHRVNWEPELIEVDVKLKPRVLLGLLLMEMKELWRAALMLTSIVWEEVERRREVYLEVEKEIVKLGLERVWEVKSLVSGKDIMKHLELKKGGPIVSEWQRKLLQWQLAYPSGSVEECVDWMKREMHR